MSEMLIQEQAGSVQARLQAKKTARWRVNFTGYGFVLPFLIIYLLFMLWPILLGLRMSFFNWSLTGSGTTTFMGLSNYAEALNDPDFWASLWHTLVFTLISTPILVILGLLLALLVNSITKAQWVFRVVFFAPFALPVTVTVLIWSWLYQPGFGLINGTLTALGLQEVGWTTNINIAMISVVILTVWWTVGTNFVLYLAGLQQIPPELTEAAALDGANRWQQARWVTIPLLGRTTFLVIILQVIASLQLFAQPYLLTAGGPNFATRPMIQYIYENGFTSYRIGYASAMSYLLFILVVIITGVLVALSSRRSNAQ